MALVILDPDLGPHSSNHRGGGRFLQMLHENLSDEAKFIDDVDKVKEDDTLLVPFWNPYRPAAVKKRYAKRQVLTIFDVIPFKHPDKFPIGFKGKLHLIENLNSMHHFDDFITISEASKTDIVQYLNIEPDKIHVVHLTSSAPFFSTKTTVKKSNNDSIKPPNLPYCIYVGDVNWNKNIVNIARSLKIAQVKGVFVGKAFTEEYVDMDHPERAEIKMFRQEIGNDNDELFIFPGYLSDENLIAFYKNALCNVLVSRDEGFGLSYLEASSQHCPSILSDIDVFNEIADDAALFAQGNDPQSIAEKIVRLRDDKAFAKELGDKAYKRSLKFKPSTFKKELSSWIF